jgi:hypothetical protein
VTDPIAWNGGEMTGSGTTQADGGLTIAHAVTLNRTFNNAGMGTWNADGPLTGSGTFVNLSGASFDIDNAQTWAASFDNRGTFTSNAAGTTTFTGAVANTGTVTAAAGLLDLQGGYTQTAGTTDLAGGDLGVGIPMALNGGVLHGMGTVFGDLLAQGGALQPGAPVGTLTIDGDLTVGSTSTAFFELAGTVQSTSYDLLAVSGNATLGGALDVVFVDGFAGAVGDTFDVMTYAAVSGDFATDSFPDGYTFDRTPLANSYRLEILGVTGGEVSDMPDPFVPLVVLEDHTGHRGVAGLVTGARIMFWSFPYCWYEVQDDGSIRFYYRER